MKTQLTAETVAISFFPFFSFFFLQTAEDEDAANGRNCHDLFFFLFFSFFSCRLLKMKTQLTAETVARKIADETLEMQVKLMSELRLTIQV